MDKLPRIRGRFDNLPKESRKTSLGGYVFRALKDELTPKQAKLPLNNQ